MFKPLYDRVLAWSGHPHAPWYLVGLSAAESSFFPVPPDVLLAPMCLAKPRLAWRYAMLCTLASVAGGVIGYLVGRLAFHTIESWLLDSAWAPAFEQAVASFEAHGFWYIVVAGFTPIPYKVFTISAGVVGMPLWPFIAGSLAGRGGRFFLVAGLIRLGGEQAAERLRRWVDLIGWSVLALILLAFTAWQLGWIGA